MQATSRSASVGPVLFRYLRKKILPTGLPHQSLTLRRQGDDGPAVIIHLRDVAMTATHEIQVDLPCFLSPGPVNHLRYVLLRQRRAIRTTRLTRPPKTKRLFQ